MPESSPAGPRYVRPPGLDTRVLSEEDWRERLEKRTQDVHRIKTTTWAYCRVLNAGVAPPDPEIDGHYDSKWFWNSKYISWRDGIKTLAWSLPMEY